MSKGIVRILEDEFFAASHLRDVVEELGFSVSSIHHSGESFLDQLNDEFDVAIIDIRLAGQINGIDVADRLNSMNKPFIFLTANNDQFTLEQAAKMKPAAYISKPFNKMDLNAVLHMLAPSFIRPILVKTKQGVKHIPPDKILFVKADNVYIEIVTKAGSFIERKLLKEIELELPDYFVRTHRSYLVNSKQAKRKNSSTLVCGPYEIPISRSFKATLKEIL